jgi:2'-5' RNA ligase
MRSFIAIELPLAVQGAVRHLQQQLQSQLRDRSLSTLVNWTPVEKIHLTLRFLGETEATQAAALAPGLARLARQAAPFSVHLAGLGCFPNLRQPRILWLGMAGDLTSLAQVQAQCELLAQEVGLAREARPFSPHLTIARLARNTSRASSNVLGQAIQPLVDQRTPAQPLTPFLVEEIVWLQSELLPGGARAPKLERPFSWSPVLGRWRCG